MMEKAIAEFGAVDVLVNNAGSSVAPVDEFPLDKWDAIIANQSLVVVPHHARGAAGDEEEWLGRGHQHRSAHALVGGARSSRPTSRRKHGIAGFTKTVALKSPRRASPSTRSVPVMCSAF